VYIVPTRKTVTSAETSDLFIRYIFPHTGVMEQLISDRGPQFASKISQHIFKTLGIKSTLSTAYHPQTDGQTKRFNQELEQYLRAFCNYRQDNWVKWLPLAQFAHNSQVTTSTGRLPFNLLYGFTPRSLPSIVPDARWPDVEARLQDLEDAHSTARAALGLAADQMKDRQDFSRLPTAHQVGDRVWLEGTHLRMQRPKAKLDAKQFGPFVISAKLGPVPYQLDIPSTWKNTCIHPVFYASLLTPYIETPEHGPNHSQPPPIVTQEGDEDGNTYEVKKVLDARSTRNRQGWEYLVKWLGYGDVDNMWVKRSEMTTSAEAVGNHHHNHPQAPKPTDIDTWLKKYDAHPGKDAS
jgi:hypothetical protein